MKGLLKLLVTIVVLPFALAWAVITLPFAVKKANRVKDVMKLFTTEEQELITKAKLYLGEASEFDLGDERSERLVSRLTMKNEEISVAAKTILRECKRYIQMSEHSKVEQSFKEFIQPQIDDAEFDAIEHFRLDLVYPDNQHFQQCYLGVSSMDIMTNWDYVCEHSSGNANYDLAVRQFEEIFDHLKTYPDPNVKYIAVKEEFYKAAQKYDLLDNFEDRARDAGLRLRSVAVAPVGSYEGMPPDDYIVFETNVSIKNHWESFCEYRSIARA